MSRRKPAPDLIRGGHRFADKDMRQASTLQILLDFKRQTLGR
jgi:hypothetical protein